MAGSLNLIPEQEVHEQQKTTAVKFSSIFSIFLLVVVSAISAYSIYYTANIKSKIKKEESNIESLRGQIAGMSQIEIAARNLDKKYRAVNAVLGSRSYYSRMMEDLRARKPEGVSVDSFSITKDSQIVITGKAGNYILIKTFANNLLAKDLPGTDPKAQGMFTSVVLNQADLGMEGTTSFSMNVAFDAAKLHYVE